MTRRKFLKGMPRWFKVALCLVGVAGAWPGFPANAVNSDQGANFADQDKDSDGLTNGEEALYNTDPNNANTDGDDKDDAEDGWAGAKGDAASNTEQGKLSPPRLPQPSYAAIVASKIPNSYKIWYVNGKGQAVVNDDPGNAYDHFYFWEKGATQGTPIPIPAPPTSSSYTPNQTITGLSENGTVIGTLFENDSHVKGMYEGDFSPRAFGWWWRPGDAAVTKLKEAPLTEDCEAYWVSPGLIRGPLGNEIVYADRYMLSYVANTGTSSDPYAGDVERYATLKWTGLTAETPTDFTYERYDPLWGFAGGEVVDTTDQTGPEDPMKRQDLLDANASGVSIGDRDLLKKYVVKVKRSGGSYVGSWTTTPQFELPSRTDIPNQLVSSIKDGANLIDLDGDDPFDPLKGYAHRVASAGQVLGFRDDGSESMIWAKKTPTDPYKPIVLKGLTGGWANQGYLNSRFEIAGGEKGASVAGASAPSIWLNYHSFPLLDVFPGLKDYSKLSVWGIDDQGIIKTVATLAKDASKQQILLLVPINISFQAHGDNEPLSDNKKKVLDGSGGLKDEWMPGKGKRIFPDAKSPSDSTPRDTVDVKVETGLPNTKVYLLALDIDDPTTDEVDTDPDSGQKHIIDENDETTAPGAGEDNRSGRPEFTPQGNAQVECLTDENGIAKIGGALPQLRVGKKTGDNYRIAVTVLKPDDLDNLQTEVKDSAGYVGPDEKQPSNFNGVVGPMLTVWRRIHVEQDTMVAPPNPKPSPDRQVATNGVWGTAPQGSGTITTLTCDVPQSVAADFYAGGRVVAGSTDYWLKDLGAHEAGTHLTLKFAGSLSAADKAAIGTSTIQLYDDDDKPLPAGWSALLPHQNLINNDIKAAFQVAYIDLTDQPTDYNSTDVPFVLNMPESRYTLGSDAPSKATIPSTNEYWGCTIVAGYQDFANGGDLDPSDDQSGGLGSTLTVSSRGVSVIFLETIRDRAPALKTAINNDLFQKMLWQTVAHELGHDAPSGLLSNDHNEGGIMDPQVLGTNGNSFTPWSIKRFRNADHWRK